MPDYLLSVSGRLLNPFNVTAESLRSRFPRVEVHTHYETDRGIVAATFAGVRLWDVIVSAGLPDVETFYVEARAHDGWSITLGRNEVDPSLTDRTILIAYERDGVLLPADQPLRLVVPGDGPGRRFVRGLAFLTVVEGDLPTEMDEQENSMELSARNQLKGTVKTVAMDGLMAEIVVTVAEGVELVSVITKASAQRLGLEPGKQVTVVVKSTEVMLAV